MATYVRMSPFCFGDCPGLCFLDWIFTSFLPGIAQLIEQHRYPCRAAVALADAHDDKVLVWVDVEHLLADAECVVAGIFWADEAFVVDVVPIEMVTVVAGIAICGLTYPIFAHYSSAIP